MIKSSHGDTPFSLTYGTEAVIPTEIEMPTYRTVAFDVGIDIVGRFLEGPDKVKFLIVAMDYITKWIEAKAVATITGGQAHRTMIKSSHGDTPFSLTYGTEAVIPTEIEMPTYRTVAVDVVPVEVLKDKSIKEKEVVTVIGEDGLTWMTPIVDYLKEGIILKDKKEAFFASKPDNTS
nr:hypothetical protein [Tanacetum cinerariifolium]